jgi:hypothetical protein
MEQAFDSLFSWLPCGGVGREAESGNDQDSPTLLGLAVVKDGGSVEHAERGEKIAQRHLSTSVDR